MNYRAIERKDGDEILLITTKASLCDERNCFSDNQQSTQRIPAEMLLVQKKEIEENSAGKSMKLDIDTS